MGKRRESCYRHRITMVLSIITKFQPIPPTENSANLLIIQLTNQQQFRKQKLCPIETHSSST